MINHNRLKADIRRDEGFSEKPYYDTAGKLTIGYGRNLSDVGVSKKESEMFLENDLEPIIDGLQRIYGWFDTLSPARKHAIINMAYNLGLRGFSTFKKMIRAIETDHFKLAAQEALNSKWATQVGSRATRIAIVIRTGNYYE